MGIFFLSKGGMFELKGEFAPTWIPGTILFPDVDGNEAEEVAEHRE